MSVNRELPTQTCTDCGNAYKSHRGGPCHGCVERRWRERYLARQEVDIEWPLWSYALSEAIRDESELVDRWECEDEHELGYEEWLIGLALHSTQPWEPPAFSLQDWVERFVEDEQLFEESPDISEDDERRVAEIVAPILAEAFRGYWHERPDCRPRLSDLVAILETAELERGAK